MAATVREEGAVAAIADVERMEDFARSASLSTAGGHRLSDTVLLTNAERDALHVEIHTYFSWLLARVVELETSESGRKAAKRADVTASGLRGLLSKMKSTFKILGRCNAANAFIKEE